MKRQMQANEIRTNIVFEFAVVGEPNVRALFNMIMESLDDCVEKKVNARLVGVNLKKPTANGVYLTKSTVAINVSKTLPLENLVSEEEEDDLESTDESEDAEEEVDEDDKESDRND